MSLNDIVKAIGTGFTNFRFVDVLDILLIALLIMWLIIFAKKSRAYQLLRGVAIAFIILVGSQVFGLTTLSWLLDTVLFSGIVFIAVIFQPELRRALEHLGRGSKIFEKNIGDRPADSILRAVTRLSKRRVGALIIFEQRIALGDILSSGTKLDAIISAELIENIFEPNTPLHDGALIVQKDKLAAAACIIPLNGEVELPGELGTRHRAAVSLSMISDCISLVVSEETGHISYASEGTLYRNIDSQGLSSLLSTIFVDNDNNDTNEKKGPTAVIKKIRRSVSKNGKKD